MKVAIYAPNYLPAVRYGGPVQSSHGLAKALVGQGCAVDVFTTDVDGPDRLDVPLGIPVSIDGVRVRYFPIVAPRRIYRAPAMTAALDRLLPESDILHINGAYLLPGPTAARIARRHGVPYVHAPRGMLAPDMIAGKSRWVKRAWIASLERAALRGAAAIHATADLEAEGLRRLGLDLAPIHVIANGVDMPARVDTALSERLWSGMPRGQRVAMLGRLDWMKGMDVAIRAIAHVPGSHLRIAGPDHAGLRPSLERLAREAGVAERVSFAGLIEGERKWALLAGADVVLVPSLRESFGMTVVEALAVGTPVIVTEGVGASTIVRRIDPDCVVERTPQALASAIHRLLGNPARRDAIGAAGAALVSRDYGWDAIAARTIALYREAIAAGPQRARRPAQPGHPSHAGI